MAYEVRTPVFEGPFDLLLHLIVKEQVDVYQVSLAGIVEGFLAEIERMRTLDLDIATEFLVIAATLVELKTRRMLPGAESVADEDDIDLLEERDLLLARLLECKTFRDAGGALARMADAASCSRPRTAGLEERFLALAPDLLAGVGPAHVHAAYLRAMQPRPLPPRIDLDHVAPIRISVGDTVTALASSLAREGRTTFRSLADGLGRLEVIVNFLAVLELYKQGRVEVEQASTFGELTVTWTGAGEAAPVTSDQYEPEPEPELARHG